MYDWDLSAFYPEDNNLSNSDGVLYPVGQEQEVSSVESWLHATTEIVGVYTWSKLESLTSFDRKLNNLAKTWRNDFKYYET